MDSRAGNGPGGSGSGGGRDRRKAFKKRLDADESRRKREDQLTQVRRERKEESLKKKRWNGRARTGADEDGEHGDACARAERKRFMVQYIPTLLANLRVRDPSRQLEALRQFRKMLSVKDPPVDAVIGSGAVAFFLAFLKRDDLPQMQYEAAWVITNITSGSSEHTELVVRSGALPLLVRLLDRESPADGNDRDGIGKVKEQAVWALGNISGDSWRLRDATLDHGVMPPLLHTLLSSASSEGLLRNCTWLLGNLCRGKPPPRFERVRPCLELGCFDRLLCVGDKEVVIDACWALSYLSDGADEEIQATIDAGVVPKLLEHVRIQDTEIVLPVLRTLGNIVTGSDVQTQYIIDMGALSGIMNIFNHHSNHSIRKEACWTLSNITAGNLDQINAVIASGVVPFLVHMLADGEFRIKREAAWAISNALSKGNHDHVDFLVQKCMCIKPMCDLLVCEDVKVINILLEGIDNILKVGAAKVALSEQRIDNPYVPMIDECDGIEKLEGLQQHENEEVYKKAMYILEEYMVAEDEEEGTTAGFMPEQQVDLQQGQYVFAGQTAANNGAIVFKF